MGQMKKAFILVMLLLLLPGCAAGQYSTASTSPKVSAGVSETQTYSQEYLSSIVTEIMNYQASHQNSRDKLADAIVGTSITNGHVVVELTEVNEELIALFKEKISDSEAVIFQKGEKYELLY